MCIRDSSKQEVVVKIRKDLNLSEAQAVGVIGWRYYVGEWDRGTLKKIKYKKFIAPLPLQMVKNRASDYKIGKSGN